MSELTEVPFQVQQVEFQRDFYIAPLTGCDMLLGIPWIETHLPLWDTRSTTFFLLEGVPAPTAIVCDRRLPGIPLVSHVQAHYAIKKGAQCALIYVQAQPHHATISGIS